MFEGIVSDLWLKYKSLFLFGLSERFNLITCRFLWGLASFSHKVLHGLPVNGLKLLRYLLLFLIDRRGLL